MERLRTPFLIAAIVLALVAILVETGTALPGVLRGNQVSIQNFQLPTQISDAKLTSDQQSVVDQVSKQERPAGQSTPDLALIDVILLFTVALMGCALLIPARLLGRVQGIATLIFSIVLIGTALRQIFVALASLILMLSLLLAIPFGSIIYLIVYGSFNRGGADIVLALLLLLKFGIAICLFLAQQRNLENIGLIILVLTSLVGNILVSFLLGFVPGVLVSITDAIGAIVLGIIAVVWAVLLLVGAIISIVKILRLPTIPHS
jgi:hypothetical protein